MQPVIKKAPVIPGPFLLQVAFIFARFLQKDSLLNLFLQEKQLQVWQKSDKPVSLRPHSGDVTEWLGRGLQNLLQRFESARHLFIVPVLVAQCPG